MTDEPHWRLRRRRTREVHHEHTRENIPQEVLDRLAYLEARVAELEKFATAASEEIIAARKEHATHDHHFQIAEHLEASTMIDGKPFPVTITQKGAAA